VETDAQREELIALGVRNAQGFIMSPPMPAADTTQFLRHPRSLAEHTSAVLT
jgi:EAL domain-containing protein (putative c-di-GMP-specific phosphodiesterase class I)